MEILQTKYNTNKSCRKLEVPENLFSIYGTKVTTIEPSTLFTKTDEFITDYWNNLDIDTNAIHILLSSTVDETTGKAKVIGNILEWELFINTDIPDGEEVEIGEEFKFYVTFDTNNKSMYTLPEFIEKIEKNELALVRYEEIDDKPVYIWAHIEVGAYSCCDTTVVVRHTNEINAISKVEIDDNTVYLVINS